MSKKGMKYDYKKAYDKNLKPSARLHYLENARHDQDAGSPNNFMGGIAGALGGALGQKADRTGFERLAQMDGIFGKLGQQVLDQNPVSAGAAPVAPAAPTVDMPGDPTLQAAGMTSSGTMDQANPFEGKTFQITPANMMGDAKPMFSEQTQGMAQTAFGSALERQMSMPNSGSVTQMSAKQAENLPPELVAEIKKKEVKEGSYGSSPLGFHQGVSHDRTVLGQKYSLGAENYADSVRVAKREQRFNEMMKPKMMKTLVDKSRVSTSTSAETSSEAQEIPRIKRK